MKKVFTFIALSSLSLLSADPYYQYGGSSSSSVRDNSQQQPSQYYRQNSQGDQSRYYDKQYQQQPQYSDQEQSKQSYQPQQHWNRPTQKEQDYQRAGQYDRRHTSQHYSQQYQQQPQQNQDQRYDNQQQNHRYGSQQQDYYTSDDFKPAVSDQELVKKVRETLKTGWFSKGYEGLTVNINDGQVVISGQVDSIEDKNKILEKVKEINGVKRVATNITINPAKQNGDRSKWEDLKNKYPQDKALTPADRDLHAKIRDKISSGWFGKENETIILVTENGIVTISGTVDKIQDIDNYNKKIKEVDGVKEIKNNLKLKRN